MSKDVSTKWGANVRMKVCAAFPTPILANGAKKKYGFVFKEFSKLYFRCCMLYVVYALALS